MLQDELGMTKPTITKAIKGLQEKQLVKKENNFHNGIITANTYKINLFKYNKHMPYIKVKVHADFCFLVTYCIMVRETICLWNTIAKKLLHF